MDQLIATSPMERFGENLSDSTRSKQAPPQRPSPDGIPSWGRNDGFGRGLTHAQRLCQ